MPEIRIYLHKLLTEAFPLTTVYLTVGDSVRGKHRLYVEVGIPLYDVTYARDFIYLSGDFKSFPQTVLTEVKALVEKRKAEGIRSTRSTILKQYINETLKKKFPSKVVSADVSNPTLGAFNIHLYCQGLSNEYDIDYTFFRSVEGNDSDIADSAVLYMEYLINPHAPTSSPLVISDMMLRLMVQLSDKYPGRFRGVTLRDSGDVILVDILGRVDTEGKQFSASFELSKSHSPEAIRLEVHDIAHRLLGQNKLTVTYMDKA